jgi:hypothetical protein
VFRFGLFFHLLESEPSTIQMPQRCLRFARQPRSGCSLGQRLQQATRFGLRAAEVGPQRPNLGVSHVGHGLLALFR